MSMIPQLSQVCCGCANGFALFSAFLHSSAGVECFPLLFGCVTSSGSRAEDGAKGRTAAGRVAPMIRSSARLCSGVMLFFTSAALRGLDSVLRGRLGIVMILKGWR